MKNKPQISPKKVEFIKYRKILLVFFLSVILACSLVYGALSAIAYEKTLPEIRLMGNKVGLRSGDELSRYLEAISKANQHRLIKIQIGDNSIEKKIEEFGVEIDRARTAIIALNYGKSYSIFPNIEYFKLLMSSSREISPVFLWSTDTQKLLELLPNNSKEPEAAKFVIKGDAVTIEQEKSGYRVDINDFMKKIESCLAIGCEKGISVKTIEAHAVITKGKLLSFERGLKEATNRGLVLSAVEKRKKYTVAKNDIVSFLDLDKTIEQNTLWWNEANIEVYLKNTIAPKINVKGRPKQISTYDGSIISQGREGYGLQIEPSKMTIKNSLINGSSAAKLSIGTTPIEEEHVGPGFTPNRVEGKYIDVNLTEQKLYTLEGGKLIGSYRVSTGKWSMPTPVGNFVINSKADRAYSARYGLYMPYWMAFIGYEYGIHELPETPEGRKEGESSLGVPVSHGCIRLGVGDAPTVYNWADIGTPIFIHK